MATVIVNDKPVDIGNERLNLVQAAERAGEFVPHYCWHPALSVVASCRMCLVEVGKKEADGKVTMQPRVVPACQTPATDGTVVITNSPRAKFAQEQTLESLLLNHPLDCPVCDKAGECMLQDYTFEFGRATSRMVDEKNHPPNKDYIGDNITLFADRCIMCSRCVRFTREVSGTAELQIINRGHHAEIDIFPGDPLNNKLAGNVVDLCPVGALCSKDFLYKQRVWFLKDTNSVCAGCSTGCSIHVDHNKDIVYRLRPRENPKAQGHFMCDEGRFDFAYVNDRNRFDRPLYRQAEKQTPANWENLIPTLRNEFAEAAKTAGSRVAAVLSPMLTVEEAYLLAKTIKGWAKDATLYLGWVPVVDEDDKYPKDRKGNVVEPVKFTIRAEKCPNRKGVEEVLKHFEGQVRTFDQAIAAAEGGKLDALYLTAGYSPRLGKWASDSQVQSLSKVPLLVVQDLQPSAVSQAAKIVVPASTWAEKDGVFVNHAGLAQRIQVAVRPSLSGRADGQIFSELMQRRGLVQASTIRTELAAEIPFFAPLASDLGEHGTVLAAK